MNDRIISNIKSLAIDMIQNAKSGHPGIVLGAAPILYTLFANHLNINPSDSKWINRDRFILSSGHGSALLYSTLYMSGFNITLDDLKQFRRISSITPGHPEYGITPGVEMTTGPLGQGFATAIGMALAEAKLQHQTKFPNQKDNLINHKIYVLCGDGDLMEGVSYEAASLAGTLKLNNLIVLYDSNDICLDGNVNNTFKENIALRFKSMGWNYILVKNGEDIKSIDKAINKAKKSNKPTIIEVKTTIGKGSVLENTNNIHGGILKEEDYLQLKQKLNSNQNPFYIDEEAKNYFSKMVSTRISDKYVKWGNLYQEFKNGIIGNPDKYNFILSSENNPNLIDFEFSNDLKEPLRETNKKILNLIAKKNINFIGGSADLAGPTGCYLEDFDDINFENFDGKNIRFGIREHAMGAILNGLALYNFLPFGSTFLSFSDYLKPALRLSCIMNLPVTYIFSHDSINIGQDGPTHQPIEHLAALRAIPNLKVYRPCDVKELVATYNNILKERTPSAVVISKIEVPVLENSNVDISKGAYIIRKESNKLDGIIISTGTDVHTAIHIAEELYINDNLDIRVISMPCKEIFLNQDEEYKEQILPKSYKKIIIEAGSSLGWEGMVYSSKYLITLNDFGVSGTKDEVLEHMEFDYKKIKEKVISLLR